MAARDQRGKRESKAKREAFFVRVDTGDGSVAFFNATEHVGREMPFKKPKATCAMRVSDSAVAFSLLHLTNRNAATIAEKPISIPRGPLARLERRALSYELADNEVIVELSTPVRDEPKTDEPKTGEAEPSDAPAAVAELTDIFDAPAADAPAVAELTDIFADPADGDQAPAAEPAVDAEAPAAQLGELFETPDAAKAGDAPKAEEVAKADEAPKRRPQRPSVVETFHLTIRRDENGVARLESVDDEHVFELGRGAIHLSVYLKSPAVGRTLAVGFIGHVGKPLNAETITRAASMVLSSLSHLAEFRILSGIETVSVPAPSNRTAAAVTRRAEERAAFETKLYLFTEAFEPAGSGSVIVEFDLENANPTTGRLLWHLTPSPEIAEHFEEFRPVFEMALTGALRTSLGDDQIAAITYDIVLGGVDSGVIERLREVGDTIAALDLSPTQVRPHA